MPVSRSFASICFLRFTAISKTVADRYYARNARNVNKTRLRSRVADRFILAWSMLHRDLTQRWYLEPWLRFFFFYQPWPLEWFCCGDWGWPCVSIIWLSSCWSSAWSSFSLLFAFFTIVATSESDLRSVATSLSFSAPAFIFSSCKKESKICKMRANSVSREPKQSGAEVVSHKSPDLVFPEFNCIRLLRPARRSLKPRIHRPIAPLLRIANET